MRAGFRACYNRGLQENPDAQGNIRLTIRVGPGGEVSGVSAAPSGNLPASVVSCVQARASAAQFAPPEGGSAVIVVEGILLLADARLRRLFDIRIFVDVADDVRFIRRLRRDIRDRGRTVDMVVDQYLSTVRPMHLEFVEPSRRYADVILPEGGHNRIGVEMLKARVEAELRRRRA